MAVWDELRAILAQLRDEQPGPLQAFPDPHSDDGRPPFRIELAAWAVATAEDLHNRFGDSVELVVGALAYPPGRRAAGPRVSQPPAVFLDPRRAAVDLDGPAIVRSGHTLRHGLLVRNLSDEDLEIATNGHVTAAVVDPATGELVGGFAGAQRLPLVVFRVAPGQTERIPLLIGTASWTPSLGYAVPAGTWGIQATLDLGPHPSEAHRRRTPVFPLTITS